VFVLFCTKKKLCMKERREKNVEKIVCLCGQNWS
jgi:hypothetical protein